MESYMHCFAGRKFYVLKTLESANRLRRARAFQPNIQLNSFLARSPAAIGDVGAGGYLGIGQAFRFAKAIV
jgi:hypothetical protein